jgi:membrane protein
MRKNITQKWIILIFKNIGRAIHIFFKEDGIDKASILAYYSIFSSFFLLIFFVFLFSQFIGNPDTALDNMYPFSPDFFSKISPLFIQRAADISYRLEDIGLVGMGLFFFLGFLVFKKIIHFVNDMFYIRIKKGFLLKRIKEIFLLSLVGILSLFSILITGLISTVTTLFNQNEFLAVNIDPRFVDVLDNVLIKYILPFLITFSLFFILFKWIPEKKICLKSAFISALISALFWELTKRGYTYYLVNISLIGKIKGPIIAIILFGFWMELNMGIMLVGAKLTYLLDLELHES